MRVLSRRASLRYRVVASGKEMGQSEGQESVMARTLVARRFPSSTRQAFRLENSHLLSE